MPAAATMQPMNKAYVHAQVQCETQDARLREVCCHSTGLPLLAPCFEDVTSISSLPAVDGSGKEINEATASPGVTKGS